MNYGDTYTPSGAQAPIKLRGPLFVGIVTLLTLGLYAIYYVYATATHLRDYGRARGRDLGQLALERLAQLDQIDHVAAE